MMYVTVDSALWRSSLLPEGIVERWLIPDGAHVAAGAPVAEIRVEDSLHEILAPGAGMLRVRARENSVVDPGSVLAEIL